MNSEFKEMVKRLAEVYGPTGRERKAGELIASLIRPYVDELRFDTLGNLICKKSGTSGKRVMLSAHMDQIGLIVVDIDEKGFLRFGPVGGIDPEATLYRDVVFENGVRGVIYCEEKDKKGVPGLSKMFIDIGASTREEAEAHVQPGDICTYAPHFTDMGSRVSCCALDDRLCCAIVIEAMKELRSPHDVYAVFTVQEEVGLRGANLIADHVHPDLVLNFEGTTANDMPEAKGHQSVTRVGRGPAITFMDGGTVVAPKVFDALRETAKAHGIPFQLRCGVNGRTDIGRIHTDLGGCLAGGISLPCRYIHSAQSVASWEDLHNMILLADAFLKDKKYNEVLGL